MGTVHQPGTSRGALTLGHAATAYLATLDHPEPARTRRVYASTLRTLRTEFGKDSDLAELRGDAVAGWFAARWGRSAPATWNRNRDALRSFGRYCHSQGWTAGDQAAGHLAGQIHYPVFALCGGRRYSSRCPARQGTTLRGDQKILDPAVIVARSSWSVSGDSSDLTARTRCRVIVVPVFTQEGQP
jgi:hypothetical protein